MKVWTRSQEDADKFPRWRNNLFVTGLAPAVELAAIRDRGPIVVDTPLATSDLDAATGEFVHTQIVKSIRMQWTGGLS